MKAIVEWGHPKGACKDRPCGVSGQFIVENPKSACLLATQLWHTFTEGHEPGDGARWLVNTEVPRRVVWSKDYTSWIAVSILDGVERGAYAGIADREAVELIRAAAAPDWANLSKRGFSVMLEFKHMHLSVNADVLKQIEDELGSLHSTKVRAVSKYVNQDGKLVWSFQEWVHGKAAAAWIETHNKSF